VDPGRILGSKAIQSSLDGRETEVVDWFARTLPDASDIHLLGFSKPPAGSGFSAENHFVELSWSEGRVHRRAKFVLRRMPAQLPMFPGRDFAAEWAVQRLVAELGAAPVPRIIGHEDDPAVLGSRFYVMSFVEGRTPDTNPSHHQGGWLYEADAGFRNALWLNALQSLGAFHRATHGRHEIERFAKDIDGRSEFTHLLDYWSGHYALGCAGKPLSLMSELECWLRENEPPENRRAICWGDARIGNMLFDDAGLPAAFVDWELFSLGDPIRDLAYWLYSDDHFVYANGKAVSGWPSTEASIAAYERGAGVPVDRRTLAFYRIFQGYHIVSTLTRLVQIRKALGQLPADLEVGEDFTPVSYLRDQWARLLSAGQDTAETWEKSA
jgi:aminoglycoside phosphotransferase (APT) family kinase protein